MDYKVDVIRNECVEKLKQEYSIKIGEGHPLPEKLSMKQKLDAISSFFYCGKRDWSDINQGDFYTSCRNDFELYRILYASREKNIVITCYMSQLKDYFTGIAKPDIWTYDKFVAKDSFHSERVPVPDWIFTVETPATELDLARKVVQGDSQFDMSFKEVSDTINHMHLNSVQIDTINKLQVFLTNRESEIKRLYSLLELHIEGSFAQGVKTCFDAIKARMANSYHDNPDIQGQLDVLYGKVNEFLEEALDDITPELSYKWKAVNDLLDQIHSLMFENDELKRKLNNGTGQR